MSEIRLGAHIPIPIFFLFDAKELLTEEGVQFSDGGLPWAEHKIDCTASFLSNLPFNKIYHDRSMPNLLPDEKRKIKFHRQAEVLVRDELSLDTLRYIVCRSHAEKEMLKALLPNGVYKTYRNLITSTGQFDLFYKYWAFVDRVEIHTNDVYRYISIYFSRDADIRDTFHFRIEIKDYDKQKISKREINLFDGKSTQRFRFQKSIENYQVSIYLDDVLCYRNNYLPINII